MKVGCIWCGLLMFWTVSLAASEDVLKLINVFFRHGARSPSNPYPTDPYKDSWPQGLDQLTTLGMQQAYDLGNFLKKMYIDSGFMEARYNPKQIYARSTDFDRAMMSGYCALTAMFPPGLADDQMFNVQLGWQSVPVHTQNPEDDILLNMDIPLCPKYDKLRSDFYKTDEFINFNNSYQEFYAVLKNYSGQVEDPDPFTAWNVYDTYLCEITHGLTPPSWNTEEMMNTISTELIPFQYYIDFGTTEKAKLKGGVMVDQIIKNMEASIGGELENKTKMFMYPAHDDNVILLLMSMDLYEYTYITYTSTLIYELYDSPEGAKVKILFKNDSYATPATLTIPGCTEMCPFDSFVSIVSPYRVTPEEWPHLCSLETQTSADSSSSVALDLGIAVVVMLSLAAVMYIALRIKNKSSSSYVSLSNERTQDEQTSFNENTTLPSKPQTSYS